MNPIPSFFLSPAIHCQTWLSNLSDFPLYNFTFSSATWVKKKRKKDTNVETLQREEREDVTLPYLEKSWGGSLIQIFFFPPPTDKGARRKEGYLVYFSFFSTLSKLVAEHPPPHFVTDAGKKTQQSELLFFSQTFFSGRSETAISLSSKKKDPFLLPPN